MRCSKCKNGNHNRRTCGTRRTQNTRRAYNKKPQSTTSVRAANQKGTTLSPRNAQPAVMVKEKSGTVKGQRSAHELNKNSHPYSPEEVETLICLRFPELVEKSYIHEPLTTLQTQPPAHATHVAELLAYIQRNNLNTTQETLQTSLRVLSIRTQNDIPKILRQLEKQQVVTHETANMINSALLHIAQDEEVKRSALKYKTTIRTQEITTIAHNTSDPETLNLLYIFANVPKSVTRKIWKNLPQNLTPQWETLKRTILTHPSCPPGALSDPENHKNAKDAQAILVNPVTPPNIKTAILERKGNPMREA